MKLMQWYENFSNTIISFFTNDVIDFIQNNGLYIFCFFLYFIEACFILGGTWWAFFWCIVFYAISITIALSPVGEWILKLINNVRPVETKEEKDYLFPLFEEVVAIAKETNEHLPKIDLYIKDSMEINSFAFGRHSIAVTKGAIDTFSEEELQAILLHEIGHIIHGHTKTKLLVTVGNGFFSLFIIIGNILLNLFDFLNSSENPDSFHLAGGFFISVLRFILNLYIFLATFIFSIMLAENSRQNEFQADKFAYLCGFGEELTQSLYLLQKMSLSENMKLVERMQADHPRTSQKN